jgi:hypothetical protein
MAHGGAHIHIAQMRSSSTVGAIVQRVSASLPAPEVGGSVLASCLIGWGAGVAFRFVAARDRLLAATGTSTRCRW